MEGLIIEVQAQAMGKLPSVQLTPDDRQRLIEYVRAGPPGWVWSPVVPHGYTTAQVRMENGWRYGMGWNYIIYRGTHIITGLVLKALT